AELAAVDRPGQALAGEEGGAGGRAVVLDHRHEHVVRAHEVDGPAAEVAPVGGQGEAGRVQDGVGGHGGRFRRSLEDAGLPTQRQLGGQAPPGDRRHLPTAMPTAAAANSTPAPQRRTGTARAWNRRWNCQRRSGPSMPRRASTGNARANPNTAPTTAPGTVEPVRKASTTTACTAAEVTMVTRPRPSWNPKPTP